VKIYFAAVNRGEKTVSLIRKERGNLALRSFFMVLDVPALMTMGGVHNYPALQYLIAEVLQLLHSFRDLCLDCICKFEIARRYLQ